MRPIMTAESNDQSVTEVEFAVPSMMCDRCAEKIRGVLATMRGIRKVKVGLWRKRVRIQYEPSSLTNDQIRAALQTAGFDAAAL